HERRLLTPRDLLVQFLKSCVEPRQGAFEQPGHALCDRRPYLQSPPDAPGAGVRRLPNLLPVPELRRAMRSAVRPTAFRLPAMPQARLRIGERNPCRSRALAAVQGSRQALPGRRRPPRAIPGKPKWARWPRYLRTRREAMQREREYWAMFAATRLKRLLPKRPMPDHFW